MENVISPVAGPAPAQLPIQRPDLRPSADAAAIARNPQPAIPLPIPASFGRVAAVNQSRMPQTEGADSVTAVIRTLKPYGVAMLPDGANQQEKSPKNPPELTANTDANVANQG